MQLVYALEKWPLQVAASILPWDESSRADLAMFCRAITRSDSVAAVPRASRSVSAAAQITDLMACRSHLDSNIGVVHLSSDKVAPMIDNSSSFRIEHTAIRP